MATKLEKETKAEAKTQWTPAQEIIWAKNDQAITSDYWPYPNGVVFVPADVPWVGEALVRDFLEKKTVALVYPDGAELLLEPREPGLPRRRRVPRLVGRLLGRA